MTILRRAAGAAFVAAAVLAGFAILRGPSPGWPWSPPDLSRPIGIGTGAGLAALGSDPPLCRALLARAGVHDVAVPRVNGPGDCGYADGMRLATGGARTIAWKPAVTTRCAMAATIAVWEWEVVQPAAIRRFGVPVDTIENYGSYACRRIAGSGSRGWSEHATANAVDVAGFRLADGVRVTVAADWRGSDEKAAFLRDVRDGACRLFATTLSPDYNAAHRDHIHLDQARRGTTGWRACR